MKYLLPYIFAFRGALTLLSVIPALVITWEPWGLLQYGTGLFLILFGIGIRLCGIRRIGRKAHVHSAGASNLITHGIFAHVRNPLYIGNILITGGLISLFFSLSGAVLAMVYLLGLYTLVAIHEERNLIHLFGPPYKRYLSNVPRWLFRIRPYQSTLEQSTLEQSTLGNAERGNAERESVSVSEILRREKFLVTLGVFLLVLGMLELAVLPYFGELPYLGRAALFLSRHCEPYIGAAFILSVMLILIIRIAYKLHRKNGIRLVADRVPFGKETDDTLLGESEL